MNFRFGFADIKVMDALLFWLGSLFTYIGGTLLLVGMRGRSSSFTRNGQVVGFATGPLGTTALASGISSEYRAVLRFLAIDGREYFLMESMGAPHANFFMGEFVPLLLSRRDHKRVFFKTPEEQRSGGIWLFAGLLMLASYFLLHPSSLVSTGVTVGGAIAGAAALTAGLQMMGLDWRKLINGGKNLGTLAPPIVIPIEESRNIPWAPVERVKMPSPKVVKAKRPWFWHNFLFYVSLTSFCAAAVFFYETHQFMKQAAPARGSIAFVKTQPIYKEIKIFVPVVRFYGNQKNIIEFQDPTGTPLNIFTAGQEVKVLVDKQNPKNARVDLGSWNHWVCYLFFIFGTFLLMCSRSAALHAQKVRTKKVIPINVRKVS